MAGPLGDEDKPKQLAKPKDGYRESHALSPVFFLFMGALIVVYAVVFAGGIIKHKPAYAIVFGILAAVFIALLANFSRLVLEIAPDEVVFGFGLAKKRFPRSAILSCEPYQLKMSNYFGYGISAGLDRSIIFSTRKGPGVKLVVEGHARDYVVSVDSPPYVCELLGGAEPGGGDDSKDEQ